METRAHPGSERASFAWLVLAALLASLATSSCFMTRKHVVVHFSSEPSGAAVLLDGKDTGFVTPCRLTLPPDRTQAELRLDGYEPARRRLEPKRSTSSVRWSEAYVSYNTWHFPMWYRFSDCFAPVTFSRSMSPGRVFVRLKRSADH